MMHRLSLLLLLCFTCSSTFALQRGDSAPQIFGRQIDDALFALSRQSDKPKVVNFFWVQCIPCKKELPILAKKEQQYPQVQFIAVHAETNPDNGSNYELNDIQAFVNGLSAAPKTVVLGSPLLKNLYGIKGFPATVLLNKNNQVVEQIVGFNAQTVKRLDTWLQQQ